MYSSGVNMWGWNYLSGKRYADNFISTHLTEFQTAFISPWSVLHIVSPVTANHVCVWWWGGGSQVFVEFLKILVILDTFSYTYWLCKHLCKADNQDFRALFESGLFASLVSVLLKKFRLLFLILIHRTFTKISLLF